jgi:hypothetical protein
VSPGQHIPAKFTSFVENLSEPSEGELAFEPEMNITIL